MKAFSPLSYPIRHRDKPNKEKAAAFTWYIGTRRFFMYQKSTTFAKLLQQTKNCINIASNGIWKGRER
jgi:hypothetical protein